MAKRDRRRDPKSPEHRAKISAALKRYAKSPNSHLKHLHKRGEEHPQWQGGIRNDYYRRVAFQAHGEICNRCGDTDGLEVHHIDRNRRNNRPDNLEVLCRKCHANEHHGIGDRWSRDWDQCRECGRRDRKHAAKGLCSACWQMKRQGGPKWRPGAWSNRYDQCQCCGTTESRHHARGLCERCYASGKRKAKEWPGSTSTHT